MLKTAFFNVQKVALAIYLFSLAFGVYNVSNVVKEINDNGKAAVVQLVFDEDSSDSDRDRGAKKKFGSRLVGGEDDDDSAKDYLWEAKNNAIPDINAFHSKSAGYTSSPCNINTPPPWC